MKPLVTVSSYGKSAGSARARVFDWIDYLGIDVESYTYVDSNSNSLGALLRRPVTLVRSEWQLRELANRVGESSLLLSRQASPFSTGEIEESLLRRSSKGIYDFDDALQFAQTSFATALWSKRRIWGRSVAAADVVIAGNAYLAEQASAFNSSVVTIPTCVEPGDYRVKSVYELGGAPTAVWVGSPSTEKYIEGITGALLEMNRLFGLRLKVISAGSASLGALDPMVDRVNWSLDSVAEQLESADFGLMPLEDSEWARGKCAYKLLQYGAAGLPVVASPIGINATVVAAFDGLAASRPADWSEAIEALLTESTDRRRTRGIHGRVAVETGYSYSTWAASWREAVLGDGS